MRVEEFLLVDFFWQRLLCWIIYPIWNGIWFTKWCRKTPNWWYWWSSWERGRYINTFRVLFTCIFGTWTNFCSFSTPHFTFLWKSNFLFLIKINFSFSLSWLCQVIFSSTWLSYPSPRLGWFATTHHNCLILVSYPCCHCLLLVTLSLQHDCASPFRDRLLLLFVTIVFYLFLHLIMILLSLSLCLVNITLPIIAVTVSLPRQYHFAYPFLNHILLVPIPLLLLVAIVSVLLLVSSPPWDLLPPVSSPHWYHFAYPRCNCLFTLLTSLCLYLLQSYSPCPDSFSSHFRDHRCASPCLFTFFWSSPPRLFASSIPIFLSFP